MTTTAVTESKSFQEKMFEKIRDSMGDLMSNDDLKIIVETAVKKAFFDSVKIYKGNNGYGDYVDEPVIVNRLRELMKDQVKASVDGWIKDNPDAMVKLINDMMAKGFTAMVTAHLDEKMRYPLQEFAQNLRTRGVL